VSKNQAKEDSIWIALERCVVLLGGVNITVTKNGTEGMEQELDQ